VANVKSLCQLYDVDAGLAAFLERLARESGERGWWADYGTTVPHWFVSFLGMETAAIEAWTYESELIPGLLQTQEYFEAITAGPTPDEVKWLAGLRVTRRERLVDDDPLILQAVLNEAVVCRVVGGSNVMRAQIRHVIDGGTAERHSPGPAVLGRIPPCHGRAFHGVAVH
jgi:hypothetical protein